MALSQLVTPVNASTDPTLLPTMQADYTVGNTTISLDELREASDGLCIASVKKPTYTYNYLYTGRSVSSGAGTLNSVVFLNTNDPAGVDVNHTVVGGTNWPVMVSAVDAEIIKRIVAYAQQLMPQSMIDDWVAENAFNSVVQYIFDNNFGKL